MVFSKEHQLVNIADGDFTPGQRGPETAKLANTDVYGLTEFNERLPSGGYRQRDCWRCLRAGPG